MDAEIPFRAGGERVGPARWGLTLAATACLPPTPALAAGQDFLIASGALSLPLLPLFLFLLLRQHRRTRAAEQALRHARQRDTLPDSSPAPTEPSAPTAALPEPASKPRQGAALALDEAALRTILDRAPSLISVKDLSGRYVFVNDRWCRFTRRNADQVIGRDDAELFGSTEVTDAAAEVDWRADSGAGWGAGRGTGHEGDQGDGPDQGRHAAAVFEEKRSVDGTEMTLETHRFALFDRSGEPNGVCAITDDVTDCREAMRLLEQARTAAQEPGRAEGERTGAARPQPSGADDAGLLAELDADLAALTPVRRSSLVRFCEEYRAFSADLATTEDANDPAARRLAHTLKGSAANLRLDEIADTARTLERALRDGETQDTLRTLAARIDRQVAQLDASLQASSPPKTRRLSVLEAPSLTTERADEIRGLAKRLADLLALGDADALATSATLTEAIGTDSDLGLQLEAVGAKVQLFEFQRAQEQLQALVPRIERLGSPQSDATIPEEIGALAAQLGPLLDADDTAAEEVAGRLQRAVMLAPAASSLLPLAERISNAVDRFDYTAASAGLSEMERLRRELATESPVKPGPAPLTHGDEQ